ncbi:MAG: hypothetical protein JWM02_3651, partial [Frankiales bacterium]|nr:hypothetical protein [Frankiales bacterium]
PLKSRPMPEAPLISYSRNVHSQCGEDGILAELRRRLRLNSGSFVEFGAWDGKHLSNTYALLADGWKGVYIEGDETRFADLLKMKEAHGDSVVAVCAYVGVCGPDSLDELLSKTFIPLEFDVLSIDIDSYDFQVWFSLTNYSPKIVIIEGNSQVLPGIWQVHQPGICQGSSFTALVALGEHKGYKLVCHTGNLIFVRKNLVDSLGIDSASLIFPETLFNYQKHFEEMAYAQQMLADEAQRPPRDSPLRRLYRRIKTQLKR